MMSSPSDRKALRGTNLIFSRPNKSDIQQDRVAKVVEIAVGNHLLS
jgi:hypothetical protein